MIFFTRLYLLSLLLFQGLASLAQPGVLEGVLQDSDTKTPITGASINLGVTNKFDNTDAFGSFRFINLVPGQYELIASHIGYRTEIVPVEIKAGMASTIAVQLKKSTVDLSEITLNSKKTNSFNTIGQVDILLRPVNTSQDILRMVPGLFIAQHAGGGKGRGSRAWSRHYLGPAGTSLAAHAGPQVECEGGANPRNTQAQPP